MRCGVFLLFLYRDEVERLNNLFRLYNEDVMKLELYYVFLILDIEFFVIYCILKFFI